MILRRLPAIVGWVTAGATLLLVGPVAVAVALLRSSSDAQGPDLAAQLFIAALVVVITGAAWAAGWGLTRLVLRLAGRSRDDP